MGTKVFITNYAGHDYVDAERYGTLRIVTRGYVNFQSLDRLKFNVAEKLLESSPEDWLVLSGTIIVNVIAVALWYEMHGQVKLLNHDKTTQKYREIILTRESNAKMLKGLMNDASKNI